MLERQLSSIKQMAVDPTFGTAIQSPFEVVALVLQGGGARSVGGPATAIPTARCATPKC